MGIVLSFGEDGTLTAHEAFGLAMLLGALGTEAGLALAAKIQDEALADPGGHRKVELSETEEEALLGTLCELRQELLPSHLTALEDALSGGRRSAAPRCIS